MKILLLITLIFPMVFIANSSIARSLKFDLNKDVSLAPSEIGILKSAQFKLSYDLGDNQEGEFNQGFDTRIYLNNSTEVRLKKSLLKAYNNILLKTKTLQDVEIFQDTYTDIISVYFGIKLEVSLREMSKNLNDKLKTLKTLAAKGRVEITELVITERNLIEINEKLKSSKKQNKLKLTRINENLKEPISIDSIQSSLGLISHKQILKNLEGTNQIQLNDSPELNVADLEFKLAKESDNKVIQYFDVDLSQNKKLFDTRVVVSVQFSLPTFSEKTKSNAKRIKLLSEQFKHNSRVKRFHIKLDKRKSEIQRKISTNMQLNRSKYQKSTSNFLKIYSKSKGVSPVKLLNLSYAIKENDFNKNKREMEIYKLYLDYLVVSGKKMEEVRNSFIR